MSFKKGNIFSTVHSITYNMHKVKCTICIEYSLNFVHIINSDLVYNMNKIKERRKPHESNHQYPKSSLYYGK